jgi:hypothetical protein
MLENVGEVAAATHSEAFTVIPSEALDLAVQSEARYLALSVQGKLREESRPGKQRNGEIPRRPQTRTADFSE